ncbi:MAG: DUF3604 domain-containing protein [Alphaproteobacteria bacterium]
MRYIILFVLLLGAAIGFVVFGMEHHWFATSRDAGEIAAPAVPADAILARQTAVAEARDAVGAQRDRTILFGDLHMHTTFSTDAFLWALPLNGGQGIHPLAEACDYARYCSSIDFFASTDHAEALTPARWREIKRSVRQCSALSQDRDHPDLVPFVGFEWTQVGQTPDDHYGHKNVIFKDLDEDRLPARPIAAAGAATRALRTNAAGFPLTIALLDPLNITDYLDFNLFLDEVRAVPTCPVDVPSNDLPATCFEAAADPGDLVARLEAQGLEPLIIPHGTSWGFYTPPGTTFDKQLAADMRPDMFPMVEIYSGHGNSEEYRPWRAVAYDEASQTATCPAPSETYLPSCWRAGEIIRNRCLEAGEGPGECDDRAAAARRDYANMGAAGHLTVRGESPDEWLNSGQCQDCFQPAFNHRPGTSVQYSLAISEFGTQGADDEPTHFTWGFVASSDNHRARPGTGFKENSRKLNTEAGGPVNETFLHRFVGAPEDPSPVSQPISREELQRGAGLGLLEIERQSSFWLTGGLAAVHAKNRSREAIWAALERRETYATSGPRILLWFDKTQADGTSMPMGSVVTETDTPAFTVRAQGAFKQKPGCPDLGRRGLSQDQLNRLCGGECYNPGDARHAITRIEIVRIRRQKTPGEDVADLIDDPFLTHTCPADAAGCTFTFEDPAFADLGYNTLYYARAIQEPTPTVNANNLRCQYDENGTCIKVDPCYGDFRTDGDDNCLAPSEHRAWSSPIYLTHQSAPVSAAQGEETDAEGTGPDDTDPKDTDSGDVDPEDDDDGPDGEADGGEDA